VVAVQAVMRRDQWLMRGLLESSEKLQAKMQTRTMRKVGKLKVQMRIYGKYTDKP
jgi:hypothetical protein